MPDDLAEGGDRPVSTLERVVIGGVVAVILLPIAALLLMPAWNHFFPSAVQQAEARLEFLEANGASEEEVCAAKKAVENAYAEARDADGYQMAKLSADVCASSLRLKELRLGRSIY